MIMNKFKKRISKLRKRPQNAVVFGTGFGNLSEIIQVFKTVFVFETRPTIKSKNIVFRENFDDLKVLTAVDVIFVDRSLVDQLDKMTPIWTGNKSVAVAIEGDEIIGMDLSKSLFNSNYHCIGSQGFFHVWESRV